MINEAELVENLRLPLKSFRIFAIERAIQEGRSEALLAELQKCRCGEDDDECRLLLDHAISAVRARVKGETGGIEPLPPPEKVPEAFRGSDAAGRFRILSGLAPAVLPQLADWAEGELPIQDNPGVALLMLKTFSPHWPRERLRNLVPLLSTGFLSLRSAVVETLAERAPQELAGDLPRLLVSDDPRVRSLAIRGLAAIDAAEAGNHLEAILLGRDPFQKKAALRECALLSFDIVKPILLKFLAFESDSALLEDAGLILEMNPEREVPFRIAEVAETGTPAHAARLREIQTAVTEALIGSGVLREEPRVFEKLLEEFSQRSGETRLLRDFLDSLESDDPALLAIARDSLRKELGKPSVRASALRAMGWPLSESGRKRLQELLDGADEKPPPEPLAAASDKAGNADDVSRILAGIGSVDPSHTLAMIGKVLGDPKSPSDVLTTALRAATRQHAREFSSQARVLLSAADPNVVSAAIEYLGVSQPDYLFTQVGRFLKHSHPRVKTAAIKVLRSSDPIQGVSALINLLRQSDRQYRIQALSAAVHFDFSILRPKLTDFLLTPQGREILTDSLLLYQANPDPENFYCFYRLEKSLPGELAPQVTEVRMQNEKDLMEFGRLEKDFWKNRQEEFQSRFLREQEKARAGLPSYALQRLEAEKAKESRTPGAVLVFLVREYGIVLLGTLMVLGLGLAAWFAVAPPEEAAANRKPAAWSKPGRVIPPSRSFPGDGAGKQLFAPPVNPD